MTPPTAKAEIRSAMRAVRRAVSQDPLDRAARSAVIGTRIVERLGVRDVRRLMVYEPLPGEPDVAVVVEWAARGGVDIFVPAVDGPDLRVEPGDVDPATLDAVLVPGLAFTRDGHRLGQGGGHFDRFLPRLSPGCLRIGVAFKEQVVAELPVELHDETVEVVITD